MNMCRAGPIRLRQKILQKRKLGCCNALLPAQIYSRNRSRLFLKSRALYYRELITLGPRTVLPRLVLSSDQCSQRNFPNPHLVLFWSLIEIVFPQISALFWPISNSAPSISALFLLAQKERYPRTQCTILYLKNFSCPFLYNQ